MTSIRPFALADTEDVVTLWEECGLVRPWNDPRRDIERKVTDSAWGFLVAEDAGAIVAAVMVGYDGHRGSLNYLAVAPTHRGTGVGRRLVDHAEALLLARGCPKVNLSVRGDNPEAIGFYERLGYAIEPAAHAVALGHRLIPDEPQVRRNLR